LTSLNLNSNRIGDEGLVALLRSGFAVEQLTELFLESNAITEAGLCVLSGSTRLRSLTTLHLGWNNLTIFAIQILAGSQHLAQLRELRLDYCRSGLLGAEAVDALLKSPHLQGLRRLSLQGVELEPAQLAALRQRWGKGLTI
jgi:Ran GTPase-activating protein (RanGAP) involved in mRNA processing and transport